MKHRYERFGGIIAHEDPPFLAFVDREFMREMGLQDSCLWAGPEPPVAVLSAPTEVHLAVTNSCPNACPHCYMDSRPIDEEELSTDELKAALDALADFGVFHVAMGGGEALLRPDLFEVAEHARRRGLVPNLTISGAFLSAETARRMTVFGQVNLSVDGVGESTDSVRGRGMFLQADHAIDLLVDAGVPTGINCVVTRHNYGEIPELFAYAKAKGANEIEFLRYKPAGRGGARYDAMKTTAAQNRELVPFLSHESTRHGVAAKIDCSFVPMLCWHDPPVEYLESTATYGCEAGNVLVGAKSDGRVNGCSFLPATDLTVFDLEHRWEDYEPFLELREWAEHAPEPCASCPYLSICRGGCRAVALHVHGSYGFPDPECPRVVEYRSS